MTDYVIVGGGIYGCTVAWELAKRGEEALLLEAKAIAGGASGGLGERGVRANGRDLRELPLMRLAYDIWPRCLHEHIGGFTGYRASGTSALDRTRSRLGRRSLPSVWMQNQQGIESRLLGMPRNCANLSRKSAKTLSPLNGTVPKTAVPITPPPRVAMAL